jgi:hypothetical protein
MNYADRDQGIEDEALRVAEQMSRKKREKKTFTEKVKRLIGAK